MKFELNSSNPVAGYGVRGVEVRMGKQSGGGGVHHGATMPRTGGEVCPDKPGNLEFSDTA